MKKLLCLTLVAVIALTVTPAMAFEVKSVSVKPSNNGVIVSVNYTLDPATAIKVFFFGTKTIENDVVSIFNTTSNFTVLRIGYDHAEFLFPAKKLDDVIYFRGVNLSESVNLTIIAGIPIPVGQVNRIPPVYFCGTFMGYAR